MLIDVTFGRPGPDLGDAAAAAEDLGFDGVWIGETNTDPFVRIVPALQQTHRVTVGTAVAIAFARTPMSVAYSGQELARLSEGRFVLGLGSQVKAHVERRFAMPWSAPAARMREFILAVKAIWHAWESDEKLAFEGDFYSHTLMTPFFTPDRHAFGSPDIYLAAVGPAMTAVAGEVADGLIFHPFTTPRYLADHTLPALLEGARSRGGVDADVVVCGPVFVCVGCDETELEAAELACRQQLAFYGSTPSYRPVLEAHGWGDLQPELTRLSKEGAWEAMASLIDAPILETFASVGDPETVAADLVARWGTLADRVSLYTPYAISPATQRSLLTALRLERGAS